MLEQVAINGSISNVDCVTNNHNIFIVIAAVIIIIAHINITTNK